MNLFVCHSQAQLILAVGLAKGRFINVENHLVLFQDFCVGKKMEESLNTVFEKVFIRVGDFPEINKSWKKKIVRYYDDINFIKSKIVHNYTLVFLVCDANLPELSIMKKCLYVNKSVEFCWLEDGAYPYFENNVKVKGLAVNSLTRRVRAFIYRYIMGYGSLYSYESEFNYMGTNKNIKEIYITFPKSYRSIYNSKIIVSISRKEYLRGIDLLYNDINDDIDNTIVLVFDKSVVYSSETINKIQKVIEFLKKYCDLNYRKILYKLHPREEGDFTFLRNLKELNRNVAVEGYYNNSKNVVVIGVKSTGLMVAKKIGFTTISIAHMVGESDKNTLDFFKKINIELPKTYEDLMFLVNNQSDDCL